MNFFRRLLKSLLPNDFHQRPLPASAIELAIKDLFPRAEVEFAFGNGYDNFASHDLPFHVGIRVILAGAVMEVLGGGRVRRQLFQPYFIIVQQSVLGIIDEDRGCYMHGVYQTEPLLHTALAHEGLHGLCDVHEPTAVWNFKPEVFCQAFHNL